MGSDKSDTGLEIDKLLTSRETLMSQRDVLGEVVDSAIEEINQRLANNLPPEPSEEQRNIITKWQTLIETTESLGMDAPSPTDEILEAQESVERYQTISQLLGITSASVVVDMDIATSADESEPVLSPDPDKTDSIVSETPTPRNKDSNEVLHKNNTEKPTELSDELIEYLLGSDNLDLSPELSAQLTPDNFRLLIVKAVNELEEDVADQTIFRFASLATVEFSDDEDIHLSPVANMLDRDAGNFIQSMSSVGNFAVLSLDDLLDLKKIYNDNNMLAFAKDLIERNVDADSLDYLVMVYRYRTILKQLDDAYDRAASSLEQQEPITVKVSSSIDHYGHEHDRINLSNFNDFAYQDEAVEGPIFIDGKPVKYVESIWDL